MDFWEQLFDNEFKQRADIESLKQNLNARRSARRHTAQQIDKITNQTPSDDPPDVPEIHAW